MWYKLFCWRTTQPRKIVQLSREIIRRNKMFSCKKSETTSKKLEARVNVRFTYSSFSSYTLILSLLLPSPFHHILTASQPHHPTSTWTPHKLTLYKLTTSQPYPSTTPLTHIPQLFPSTHHLRKAQSLKSRWGGYLSLCLHCCLCRCLCPCLFLQLDLDLDLDLWRKKCRY